MGARCSESFMTILNPHACKALLHFQGLMRAGLFAGEPEHGSFKVIEDTWDFRESNGGSWKGRDETLHTLGSKSG